MRIAEQITRAKTDYDNVYHSGRLKTLKDSKCTKTTVNGSVVTVNDCSPIEHDLQVSIEEDINLLGISPAVTQTIQGVTFTNNKDGTFTANGTANAYSGYAYLSIFSNLYLEAGDYVLSGCPEGGGLENYTYVLTLEDANYSLNVIDSGNGAEFTVTEEYENTPFTITIRVFPNVTVDNLVFKPKLQSLTNSIDLSTVAITLTGTNAETKTVKANADGIVEGLKSSYPDFTLTSDTEGVIIQCGYYKDVDKACEESYEFGLEDGKQAEYDWFWDNYQNYGNRTIYTTAFGSMWTAETFKPKYSIKPTAAYMMFFNNAGHKIKIDDFVAFCEERGIEFDLSNSESNLYALASLHTARFGTLDFSKSTSTDYLFYSNTAVITIDEFISSETTKYGANTFSGATNLTNIKMSGVVNNSINFGKNAKLTKESLNSIISVLKDFSGTTTTATLTLHADSKAKLTDADKATITQKGWTLA